MRVYLAGAIEHSADGGRGWREDLAGFLREELRHDVYDPAADEKKDLTEEEIEGFRRWKLEDPDRFRDKKICVIVSGGNVDAEVYKKILG